MKNLLLLVAFFLAQAAYGLEGRVVGVHDGDTITVLDSSHAEHKIRLAQIDAPELSQEWGKNSKKALSDLVFDKFVTVVVVSIDRTHPEKPREVGIIYLNNKDICKEQIKNGNAWVYVRYAQDKSLAGVEYIARQNKVGLWSTESATPPWEWRKAKKKKYSI